MLKTVKYNTYIVSDESFIHIKKYNFVQYV